MNVTCNPTMLTIRERIVRLHIGDEVIRTTAEHPFFVRGKGWIAAGELQAGDALSSHDGKWIPVGEVFDTGEYEAVYNCRIADWHTYFVGDDSWGFSIWAHNTCNGLHHYVPVFMGSSVPRGSSLLTRFQQIGHIAIHRALNRFLQPLGMAPSASNPGRLIQRSFTKGERLKALVDFHRSYQGGAHYQAFLTEMRETLKAGRFR